MAYDTITSTRHPTYSEHKPSVFRTGVPIGITAGVLMGLTAMIHAAATGAGFWTPMQLIAATFYGPQAMDGGWGPTMVGMLFHLFNSAVFGVIFAALVRPSTSVGKAILGGLVYGAAIWAVMTYVVLPLVNPTMFSSVTQTPMWWFFYHMVFGATLGAIPALQRRSLTTSTHDQEAQADVFNQYEHDRHDRAA